MARQLEDVNASGELVSIKKGGAGADREVVVTADLNVVANEVTALDERTNGIDYLPGATDRTTFGHVPHALSLIDPALPGDLVHKQFFDATMAAAAYLIIEVRSGPYNLLGSDAGKGLRFTGLAADASITLPETATEAIEAGYGVQLFNDDPTYALLVQAQGSDVLVSPFALSVVPPGCSAVVTKMVAGAPNRWYFGLNYDEHIGGGAIGLDNIAGMEHNPTLANTWNGLVLDGFAAGDLEHVTAGADGITLAYPNHGTHTVLATINIMASINPASGDKSVDLGVWVDGAAASWNDIVFQRITTGGNHTAGMFLPLSYLVKVVVANGSKITAALRSSTATPFNLDAFTLQLGYTVIPGMDFPVSLMGATVQNL